MAPFPLTSTAAASASSRALCSSTRRRLQAASAATEPVSCTRPASPACTMRNADTAWLSAPKDMVLVVVVVVAAEPADAAAAETAAAEAAAEAAAADTAVAADAGRLFRGGSGVGEREVREHGGDPLEGVLVALQQAPPRDKPPRHRRRRAVELLRPPQLQRSAAQEGHFLGADPHADEMEAQVGFGARGGRVEAVQGPTEAQLREDRARPAIRRAEDQQPGRYGVEYAPEGRHVHGLAQRRERQVHRQPCERVHVLYKRWSGLSTTTTAAAATEQSGRRVSAPPRVTIAPSPSSSPSHGPSSSQSPRGEQLRRSPLGYFSPPPLLHALPPPPRRLTAQLQHAVEAAFRKYLERCPSGRCKVQAVRPVR